VTIIFNQHLANFDDFLDMLVDEDGVLCARKRSTYLDQHAVRRLELK
jgi:hypothetical protein